MEKAKLNIEELRALNRLRKYYYEMGDMENCLRVAKKTKDLIINR